MRTLIYARYSSQLQNPRSVDDQIAACRERAGREGWSIEGVFHDAAISGAAGIETTQRPGLHALLQRLERGGIDQVLCEATDRISRHQGDAFTVRERVEFAGARIFTLMDGEVDDITGTIKSLFDSKMRKDLAQRVRRGQRGNIVQGKSAGGVAYGYRRVALLDEQGEQVRGLREIDPDRAAIVLRIHREFAAGQSALAIARRLNADGIPPPRRGIWRAGTLLGHRKTGFGILSNPIYIGELHYGRSKQVVDPQTRRKMTRPGDGEILTGRAPHLRIVDDALWRAVQQLLQANATPYPEQKRRPKHLLSGIGVCGTCGAKWIKTRGVYWGCSTVVGSGTCTNRRLISGAEYERRVLDDLREQMLAADVVSAYLREYHREHARQSGELTRDRDRLQRKLDEASRKVTRLVAVMADGGSEFAEIRDVLTIARNDRDQLSRELASLEALPVLALHPGLAEQYRREIADLERALAQPETSSEAVPRLRKLIARIICTPAAAPRGVDVQVIRQIDEVLNLASPKTRLAQLR